MRYESVIGLEVHVQLNTNSKIFSSSSNRYGAQANSQANLIDIALPGVLPVMNASALQKAVKFGLAIDATVNKVSQFARKNYFYPDLPKGYQISQFDKPIVENGLLSIEVENEEKIIGITRAHLEEDAGKLLHERFAGKSGIDLNRAGTPLLEIVSEPDLRSAKQAVTYLRKLHSLVRHLDISDGNMQEGSFRCDANVSIREFGSKTLNTRTEIKNLNSFRFVEKAINYEIERQIEIVENKGQIIQQTRLYNPDTNETRSMRSKEQAHDYRYFPDPDLPAMVIDDEFIKNIAQSLPELPETKQRRYVDDYGLNAVDAQLICADIDIANFFEKTIKLVNNDAKSVANWINGELTAYLNKSELTINEIHINEEQLATLINRINDNTISNNIAKDLFRTLSAKPTTLSVDELISQQGLKQISDVDELETIIATILEDHPDQVKQFKAGNQKVIGFFVGKALKITSGKANPKQVNELIRKKLND